MSKIEWTGQTWNPATGCTKVSPGCDNCYMHTMYPRLKRMKAPGYDETPTTVREVPEQLEKPERRRKATLYFVCSMSDLFHAGISDSYRNEVFRVMENTAESNGHTFQLLTKRPGQALRWLRENPREWHESIWLGVSVELQKFTSRLDLLRQVPAKTRYVSAEPLLGPLELAPWLSDGTLDWVIAGGESGPGYRPMELEWARNLQEQCHEHGTAFFLKQLGGRPKRSGEQAKLDGRLWKEMPKTKAVSLVTRTR